MSGYTESDYIVSNNVSYKPDIMAHTCNPALRELRQEDCFDLL